MRALEDRVAELESQLADIHQALLGDGPADELVVQAPAEAPGQDALRAQHAAFLDRIAARRQKAGKR